MTRRVWTLSALLIAALGSTHCGANDSEATSVAPEAPPERAPDNPSPRAAQERATPDEPRPTGSDDADPSPDFAEQPMMDDQGAPSPRMGHVAVFTGTQLVVWGGDNAFPSEADGYAEVAPHAIATGGRYDPRTDVWSTTSSRGAPTATYDGVAVWTGTQMIVWGGNRAEAHPVDSGGAYDPAADRWRRTSRRGAPAPRAKADAVWTGTEMIVWGGRGRGGALGDGARYDPATDAWRPLSNDGAPSPRAGHSMLFTGTEVIVWGGLGPAGELGDGARYDLAADAWRPVSGIGAPSARTDHVAVYTGESMIVWGGQVGSSRTQDEAIRADGAVYSPGSDAWRPMTARHAYARSGAAGVWTGTHLVVLGEAEEGEDFPGPALGVYDPAADAWTNFGVFAAYGQSVVLGNGEVLTWGGTDGTNMVSEGTRIPIPVRAAP